METQFADSRTGRPFKMQRATRKDQESYLPSKLAAFFHRLGWREKPGDTSKSTMKEITLLMPVVAGGKPRKKGDVITLPDLRAAELIAMKVAELKRDLPDAKVQPWERPRTEVKKPVPALVPAK